MIPPGDRWGPFADGIEAAEQRARLRGLRALARILCGPRAADLCRLLAAAESDPAALEPAACALNRLASIDRRHVLASYASLHRGARP
jgi:hypothetical protein